MKLSRYRKEIVFILDLFIILFVSIALFCTFPDSIGISRENPMVLFRHLVLLILCGAIAQYFFKTYDSLWRYAQSKEYLMLLLGGITGYLGFLIFDYYMVDGAVPLLFTMTIYSDSLIGMLIMRLCYRQYRKKTRTIVLKDRVPVAIIGAGEAGVKLLEEVMSNPNSRYAPICLIDDSIEKIGKRIHNIEVRGPLNRLEKVLMDTQVKEAVIAIPNLKAEKQKTIMDICAKMKCRVQILPDTLAILQGDEEHSLWNRVREIRIEELLGREQIDMKEEAIENFLYQKVVMVTGGGGSIGSELCRQIAKVRPKTLIVMDIYENSAYEIQQELIGKYGDQLDIRIEIASVRDKRKVYRLLQRYRPNIIFHAAAHKHVPLMEDCPEEAIINNIFGTYHMVKAADYYKVEKFVLISTDKAVNPTNIMGASKRFCEMILQSMKENSRTEFVAVRFGNVLGSNGSVIPLFQKQIAHGGPVTITDKRIVRFFMTISEAVQLVLQAGYMANSSEVYVLDMGEPVKILELAENMIRLSGYVPYTEIPIIETGLRPGEKLYEELLLNSEELIATANQKIFIEKQKSISQRELMKKMKLLSKALKTQSIPEIKKIMKQVVPTYRDPEEVNNRK